MTCDINKFNNELIGVGLDPSHEYQIEIGYIDVAELGAHNFCGITVTVH